MPSVIKFRDPIGAATGETDFALRTLIIDFDPKAPLVKMMLQQVDATGTFVENGETIPVRHAGAAAEAFLNNVQYKAVLESLPQALVAGSSLPKPADVVAVEPAPVEPKP